MDLEKYPVDSDADLLRHVFYSEGPKGRMKKVILFQKAGPDYFNLALRDEGKYTPSDVVVEINKNDVDKIFATIASVIVNFMKLYPGAMVVAAGDMVVKTRLYRMKINKHLMVIQTLFSLQGWYPYAWENFRSDRNYEAFAIKTKIKK